MGNNSSRTGEELVTVSAKIPRSLRRKLEEYGISPSKVIKKALEDAVKEAELRTIEKELARLDHIISRISVEDVLIGIRIEREGGRREFLKLRHPSERETN